MHNLLYNTVVQASMLEILSTCINEQFGDYFSKQINLQEIFCTQISCTLYLKASTGVKISTFLRKMGG